MRDEVDREPRQVHDRVPPKIYFPLQRHSAITMRRCNEVIAN